MVLLLVSAGMATAPGGEDTPAQIRDFYLQHRQMVLVAQLLGLAAAGSFAMFARALGRPTDGRPGSTAVRRSGYGVTMAAVGTSIPVLWLSLGADRISGRMLHDLASASDWTDTVLFAAIAAFAFTVTAWTKARWLRLEAVGVMVVAAARAVVPSASAEALELLAPLAFIGLIISVVLSALVNRRRPHST